MKQYDYIIVGSGIAGLYTALLANEHGKVLVITKGSIDDCNTKHAQGGIAAPIGRDDSPEAHFRDTLAAGAGLCDEDSVRILTGEAADRISDLVNFGVPFDTLEGTIALTMEGAHSVPRILHAGGDATGAYIEDTLSQRVRACKIQVLEHCLVTEIVVAGGRATGVKAIDLGTGSVEEFDCRRLILATGGGGQLYKYTTNPEVATADGVALAYRAGAEIADMEFFQFHPTALRMPGVPTFLISEAVRGEGGVLRNVKGHRFMPDYTPDAELAPRDVVARSIVYEMQKTGSDRVLLDVTHLPPYVITTRFPTIYQFCREHGLYITDTLIPVAPAAHYMMGGVKTNTRGETSIAGLFAVGEVACTGVHGANRLASNSMLEVLVFSKRAVARAEGGDQDTGAESRSTDIKTYLKKPRAAGKVPPLTVSAIQHLMWEKVGILRDGNNLAEAAACMAAWQKLVSRPVDRHSYELYNMVLAGRLVIEAALIREESRGAHFRSDFSQTQPEWQRHIIFVKRE